MSDAALEVRSASKHYGGIRALHQVDLEVAQGEVHGIIGPNGSGKSTLMKIIAGFETPDFGSVMIFGNPLKRADALEARRSGVTMVPQELTVATTLSVTENVVTGSEPRRWSAFVSSRTATKETARLLEVLGLQVDPSTLVADLNLAQRRLVMLAAALHRGGRLFILDEPTAGMPAHETQAVYDAINRLKAAGLTCLLISHRLDELINFSDSVTVLREGEVVGRFGDRKPTRAELVGLVAPSLGAQRTPAAAAGPATAPAAGVVLELSNASFSSLRSLDLQVRRGDAVGVVGGLGSGLEQLAQLLSGQSVAALGTVRAGEQDLRRVRRTGDITKAGVLFISGERHRFVIRDRSVGFHICLPSISLRTRYLVVSGRRERRTAEEALNRVGVKASADQPIGSLSGGNQQRALFARASVTNPSLLVAHEPSVGVDVGGREVLRQHMREMRKEHGLLVLSSDPEEVVGLCERVLCLRDGLVSAEYEGEHITVAALLEATS